jgi:hypothetical protein
MDFTSVYFFSTNTVPIFVKPVTRELYKEVTGRFVYSVKSWNLTSTLLLRILWTCKLSTPVSLCICIYNQHDKQQSWIDFGPLLTDGANDSNTAGGVGGIRGVHCIPSEGQGVSRQKTGEYARTKSIPTDWQPSGINGTTQSYVSPIFRAENINLLHCWKWESVVTFAALREERTAVSHGLCRNL